MHEPKPKRPISERKRRAAMRNLAMANRALAKQPPSPRKRAAIMANLAKANAAPHILRAHAVLTRPEPFQARLHTNQEGLCSKSFRVRNFCAVRSPASGPAPGPQGIEGKGETGKSPGMALGLLSLRVRAWRGRETGNRKAESAVLLFLRAENGRRAFSATPTGARAPAEIAARKGGWS
jgi:hypothetical protein